MLNRWQENLINLSLKLEIYNKKLIIKDETIINSKIDTNNSRQKFQAKEKIKKQLLNNIISDKFLI